MPIWRDQSGMCLRLYSGAFVQLTVTVIIILLSAVQSRPALQELTATQAREVLCSREVSAVDYNKALLERISDVACLNTFATLDTEKVLREAAEVDAKAAKGESIEPLCGLGFAVKDNIDYTEYPTKAGSPALADNMPLRNNPLVTKLREANGVVLGKTRMHELAYGITTINPDNGTVLNPYNNLMHCGGSSGGTASIVAARGASAGFCSDTGGSCRIPASMTGTFGWRPSLGCWNSADGTVPMTYTRDTVGVMARSMDDIIMYDELFGDCPRPAEGSVQGLKGVRLGFPHQLWDDLDGDVMPVLEKTLLALQREGAVIVKFDYGLMKHAVDEWVPYKLSCDWEMPRELARYLWRHGGKITVNELVDKIASPSVKPLLERQLDLGLDTPGETPDDHAKMLREGQPAAIKLLQQHFESYRLDALIMPSTPAASKPIDNVEPWMETSNGWRDALHTYCRSMLLESALRLPSISLPAGLTASGLPIGIQFSAQAGEDVKLLSLAKLVEPLLPSTPPPPFPPACQGCRAIIDTQEVTYLGEGEPELDDVTSFYTFSLEGNCQLRQAQASSAGSVQQCAMADSGPQQCST